jgi:hypothetical protein
MPRAGKIDPPTGSVIVLPLSTDIDRPASNTLIAAERFNAGSPVGRSSSPAGTSTRLEAVMTLGGHRDLPP